MKARRFKVGKETDWSGYICACKAKHVFPMYAVAQAAMGYSLTHTCEKCGRANEVDRRLSVTLGPAPRRAA